MTRLWALLVCALLASAADESFPLPWWLPPFPGASGQVQKASAASATQSYTAPAPPETVASFYKEKLQKAEVPFEQTFNGIGPTISAATRWTSCIVRISETDSGSSVSVACAPNPQKPAGSAIPAPAVPDAAKPTSKPDAPAPDAKGAITVVYEVTGTAKKVEIAYRNASGRTEKVTVGLPYNTSFSGKPGSLVYLSAENTDRDGNIQVTIRINGSIVHQDATERAFGVVVVQGRIPN